MCIRDRLNGPAATSSTAASAATERATVPTGFKRSLISFSVPGGNAFTAKTLKITANPETVNKRRLNRVLLANCFDFCVSKNNLEPLLLLMPKSVQCAPLWLQAPPDCRSGLASGADYSLTLTRRRITRDRLTCAEFHWCRRRFHRAWHPATACPQDNR